MVTKKGRKQSANSKKLFKLKGKTLVCVDWANVFGWQTTLGWSVNPRKLYFYLKKYKEIDEVRFYFGTDKHPKSKEFIRKMCSVGYSVVTKRVKYVPVSLDGSYFKKTFLEMKQSISELRGLDAKDAEKLLKILNQKILRRKCDFDIEIAMDVRDRIDKIDGLILFSGDGDYAPLLKWCLNQGKQVIVVSARGRLGKEISRLIERKRQRVYICFVSRLKAFIN